MFEAKNSEDDERKVGPGTPRNTKEPQRTPPTPSYVSTTQVTNEWAMSTIENNSATPRDLSSVRAWMESSKYGEYEKSRNMINVPLAREKSTLKDGCNDAQCTGEKDALFHSIYIWNASELQSHQALKTCPMPRADLLSYFVYYPLIVQPLAPYMVLVRHIFTTLQYTFKTLQELFQHNKHVLLLFY